MALANGYAFRRLTDEHRPALMRLYSQLSQESVRSRFGAAMSLALVERYLAQMDFRAWYIIGAFSGDELVGVCECAPAPAPADIVTELAFTVADAHQGRQIGKALGQRALEALRGCVFLTCSSSNRPMRKLAHNLGLAPAIGSPLKERVRALSELEDSFVVAV